ncbi:MAG: hypothetical protein H7A26_06815 [Spirochaetales bacterium]|nr:hypothetical protein [Spirochaetales bacterium]
MSNFAITGNVRIRRILIRAAFILFMLILAVFLFFGGKAHTLLLDNKTIEKEGKIYRELNVVEVRIGSGKEEELLKKDRVKIDVSGQRQVITVTFPGDDGNEKIIKKTFHLKAGVPMYLISIPAFIAGADGWIEPFEPSN